MGGHGRKKEFAVEEKPASANSRKELRTSSVQEKWEGGAFTRN